MARAKQPQPWLGAPRPEAARHILSLLFNLAFGALAAGFLAWGPLALSWPLVAVFGLAGGVLNVGLWARQQLAAARRWRHSLLLGHLAIALAVGLTATMQLYLVGLMPPFSQDRVVAMERLWRAAEAHYPYFDLKGVDWRAVRAHYLPQARAAGLERGAVSDALNVAVGHNPFSWRKRRDSNPRSPP